MPVMTSDAVDDLTIATPQSGKSVAGACWLLASAWMHGADPNPWWWCAPTYAQVKTGFIKRVVYLAHSAGILESYTTSPPLQAKLTCGALLEGRSWERPGGMYADTVLGYVVDEFGQLTDEGYSAMSSRRADSIRRGMGRARYLGNVGQVGGPAEHLWDMAEAGEPGFASRRWTWQIQAKEIPCLCAPGGIEPNISDNAPSHHPGCERGVFVLFIRNEASRMSEPQFRQLYGAEWADWNLLPVYTFNREAHVSAEWDYQPALPLELSCDFNVDPMAWVVGQHKNGTAWDLDEIIIPAGATTRMACIEFKRRYPKVHSLSVYGDASGKARDTRSRQTDYQIIQEELSGHCINFRMDVPSHNGAVTARVNAVNAKLAPAIGEPTYFIHPRCTHLIKDRSRVSWKPGTREIDKRNKALTHASDASDYRLVYLYPVVKAATFQVGTAASAPLPRDSMFNVEF